MTKRFEFIIIKRKSKFFQNFSWLNRDPLLYIFFCIYAKICYCFICI